MKRGSTTVRYQDYLDTLLEDSRLRVINDGAYAHVFTVPNHKKLIAKVFRPREDFAYFTYLQWCLEHQDNPYVPKIHDVYVYDFINDTGNKRVDDKDEIAIVFMEKLSYISRGKYNSFAKSVVKDHKLTFSTSDPGELPAGTDAFCHFNDSHWEKIARSKDRHLAQFAKFMVKAVKKFGNDCHDGNIMVRGTQAVFTDVVCV